VSLFLDESGEKKFDPKKHTFLDKPKEKKKKPSAKLYSLS